MESEKLRELELKVASLEVKLELAEQALQQILRSLEKLENPKIGR